MARDRAGLVDQAGGLQVGQQPFRRIAVEQLGRDERDLGRLGAGDGLAPVGQIVGQGRGGVDQVDQSHGAAVALEIAVAGGQVLAHVVRGGDLALADRVGQQQAGEGLGDRADLVDAALGRGRTSVLGDDAGIIEARAPAAHDGGGEAVGLPSLYEIRDQRADRIGRRRRVRHA